MNTNDTNRGIGLGGFGPENRLVIAKIGNRGIVGLWVERSSIIRLPILAITNLEGPIANC
jgi:hypothetical protein